MRSIFLFSILVAWFVSNTNGASADKGEKQKTACDVIHQEYLPDECTCSEPGPYSVVVECNKAFRSEYFNDTIGMKVDLDLCNKLGSRISLDITEKEHDIDFPITGIRAGESKNIPIPGLSIAVPGVGHLGVDAAVLILGNPDQLTLKVGLNACLGIGHHKDLCASSIPGLNRVLPWYVLSGTYSFGDICESRAKVAMKRLLRIFGI